LDLSSNALNARGIGLLAQGLLQLLPSNQLRLSLADNNASAIGAAALMSACTQLPQACATSI
jgi:hypothetical protein